MRELSERKIKTPKTDDYSAKFGIAIQGPKKIKKNLKKVLTFRPGCSIIIHVAERYSKMAKRQRHVGA